MQGNGNAATAFIENGAKDSFKSWPCSVQDKFKTNLEWNCKDKL